ncbi:MAG TPA: hypothetical protein VMH81_12220 [Bryobacteraceae bacterium]|nr:hypothetical protein [Bryobacteraceae bacterium]
MQRPDVQRPQRPEREPGGSGPESRPPVRDLGGGGGSAVPPGGPGSGGSGSPAGTSGQGGPAGGGQPASGTGSKPIVAGPLVKIVALGALLVGGWFWFKPAPVYTGPEEMAPHYTDNKNADPRVPAIFAAKDINHKLTDDARQAAQRGEPIPGITNPSPALIDAVKNGKVTFYAVRAYDTCAEDGDVVTLRLPIGGEIGPIPLTIAGTVVSIPVVEGQPAAVTVVGVRDGVGGITVGVQTSGGVWYSKVMAVGETENMALSIR